MKNVVSQVEKSFFEMKRDVEMADREKNRKTGALY